MRKRCLIITISLVILFVKVAYSQVLPLDSILGTIERNNPELKMYDAQINALNTYATGAKSWDAPQIGTGFFMTPYNPMMWKSDPSKYYNGMGQYMFSIKQMIPNSKKLNANKTYMESMSGVEVQSKNFMRNKLFSEAKMNYYEWVLLIKKGKILKETESLLKLVIQTTEIRYSYNQEKLGSIYKAKAQLAEIQSMQLMYENEAKQKMIMLNTLMNKDKTKNFSIDTTFQLKNYDVEILDTSSLASLRSDLKAIDKSIFSLMAKKQMEYSKRLPDFGISYDHMYTFGNQPQLYSLMGMMSIPIAPWSRKAYKANVSALDFEVQALQIQKQSITNETTGKLQTLKTKINFQKQQLKLYEESILPSLKKNYQSSLLSYEQNTGDLFIVLDAIQMLKMSQLTYLDQLQQLLTLQTEYEKEIEQR
jgi:outer membrane protein TolC